MRRKCAICNSDKIVHETRFNVRVKSNRLTFVIPEVPEGSCMTCILTDLWRKFLTHSPKLLRPLLQSDISVNWQNFERARGKTREEMTDLLVALGFLTSDGKWDVLVGEKKDQRSVCPMGLGFVSRKDAIEFGHQYNDHHIVCTEIVPRVYKIQSLRSFIYARHKLDSQLARLVA